MSDNPLRVAVIVGSTREGRFGPVVAGWFARQAARRADMAVDVVDLAEADLPAAYPRHPGPAVTAFRRRIGRADAFVVVTPEYNHGYPAPLKQAIDLVGEEWARKPVGFVSYGGVSGGLRAVEQLRVVFPELHAMTVRNTVSFHGAWRQFDAEGEPVDPDGCTPAADALLDDLAWWGAALRAARSVDATEGTEEAVA